MHHHHHTHSSFHHNHHHHHSTWHHGVSGNIESLTYQERVKAMKASLAISIFIIVFAIGFALAAILIVQRSSFSSFVFLPFIFFPFAMVIFGIIGIVRAAKFLNSEPPVPEEATKENESKTEEASATEAFTASPNVSSTLAQNCVCPKCGFIYDRKEEKCPQCGEITKDS